mgnify:CR=1 FL=1
MKSKPLGWYWHKILCRIGYKISGTSDMYYKNLMIICDGYGFNFYGDPIPKNQTSKYYRK